MIKFQPKSETALCIDIALPRKEKSTGVGHRDFEVDFDPMIPVEVDLSRRDFTINAMAREMKSFALIDPFNGHQDLKNKILKTVSPKSFEEDPLRLMRAVQFAARFDLRIDTDTFESMKNNSPLIKTVSPERISEEIKKLLFAEKPSLGFILMDKVGLLKEVFPELAENVGVEQGNKFQNDDVFMHTMKVLDASRKDSAIPQAGDLELMLSALFHDVGKARTKRFDKKKNRLTFYNHQFLSRKMAKARMQALKMSVLGIDIDRVSRLVEEHMFQTKSFFLKLVDLRIADNRGGKYPEGIKGVLRLRNKIQEEIEKKTPLNVRDLAIGGKEVMALGVPEGPQIGNVLKQLLEFVLDDPDLNSQEKLTEILTHQILQKATHS
ncbi:MAG: HD domain-containing protein [Deltaproteobacteria bacterium]|nr:MAG: HD domain-containing protein [Deltaproteobacteria bacterium]